MRFLLNVISIKSNYVYEGLYIHLLANKTFIFSITGLHWKVIRCNQVLKFILFSDMMIVKPLLQLHTLLFSLPPPATIANTMSTLQHTIANILLTFTTSTCYRSFLCTYCYDWCFVEKNSLDDIMQGFLFIITKQNLNTNCKFVHRAISLLQGPVYLITLVGRS